MKQGDFVTTLPKSATSRDAARADRVEMRGARAVLILDGREVDQAVFEELTRLYFVWVGDDVTATDEECFVAVLGQRVWVLPLEAPGVNTLLCEAWYAKVCASQLFFEAFLALLPWPWRKRAWGLLPVPVPRLGCFPASTLPQWREKGPARFSEFFQGRGGRGKPWATTK